MQLPCPRKTGPNLKRENRGIQVCLRGAASRPQTGGGNLSNRFHLRSRKSPDGFVCGTGNGCQPNRRSAAGGVRSPGDQRGPERFSCARLGSGQLLQAGEGQPSVSSARQRRGAHGGSRSHCNGSSGNPVCHLCRTGRRSVWDRQSSSAASLPDWSSMCQMVPSMMGC